VLQNNITFVIVVVFDVPVFTREKSYCFQRVLAIAILSVRLFVRHTGGSVKNGAK